MRIKLGNHVIGAPRKKGYRLWTVAVQAVTPESPESLFTASEYLPYYGSPSKIPQSLVQEAAGKAWERLHAQHPAATPVRVEVYYETRVADTPVHAWTETHKALKAQWAAETD